MPIFKPEYLERELKRWARPDAHLFVRPDWRRFVKPGSEAAAVFELYEQKYRPDQARVPPGSREGGQWVDEGGGGPADKSPTQVAGRISRAREAECEEQYRKDTFICNTIGTASCWGQAMFRRAQCIRGQYVPPLRF